jgi:serine/threonine-protein kinase
MSTPQPNSTSTAEAKSPTVAPKVGPYSIIGRLGKGGMAEALLCLQNDPAHGIKRLVVVKRVLAELLEDDTAVVQMFLDEARLAARLSHANVVQTYEVGQDEGLPYIAMEFLDGQSVDMVQRRAYAMGEKIAPEVALRVFCDALDGLHYAHELKDFDGKPLGVIHRDVTPSNVFVKYDGTAKLVDFGIAKSATQREKTRAGTLKGKMAYMAPEQFRDATITRSVDVWAMGVVIWETLSGERLFRSKNSFETVQAVMKREVPRLSAKRPDVPAALDDVLQQAIERDPAKRIQTAEDFKAKLEEVAFGMQKRLRASDVAKTMQSLFAKAMEQNQRLVKDFLDRTASEIDARHEFIGVSSSDGATEFKVVDRSETSEPNARMTGEIAEAASLAEKTPRPAAQSSPTPVSTPPAVAPRESAVVEAQRTKTPATSNPSNALASADGDEAPRPWWHWLALGLSLLTIAAAIYYVVSA